MHVQEHLRTHFCLCVFVYITLLFPLKEPSKDTPGPISTSSTQILISTNQSALKSICISPQRNEPGTSCYSRQYRMPPKMR